MRFSKAALIAAVAIPAPLFTSAFAPSPAFARSGSIAKSIVSGKTKNAALRTQSTHGAGCPCSACSKSKRHPASCNCPSCALSATLLRMSEEATVAETDLPVEVAAVDGVLSEDEAHNVERPTRASGLHKHRNKKSQAGKPLSELQVGATVEGRVKGITSFGAFLDIGYEADALLHVSRLSDDFVSNVEDVVKSGDVVTVRVASVDLDKKQVAVTMRSEEAEARAAAPREARASASGKRRERPQRSDGDRDAQRTALLALAEKGFDETKFVEGEVVNTLDFGAFVRFDTSQLGEGLTGELDGLVHISALCAGRADSVNALVNVGDKVQVRVKNVDVNGNKVALSMISREEENSGRSRSSNESNEGGGGRGSNRPSGLQQSISDKGAADWKESLEKFHGNEPAFKNLPIVESKRKKQGSLV